VKPCLPDFRLLWLGLAWRGLAWHHLRTEVGEQPTYCRRHRLSIRSGALRGASTLFASKLTGPLAMPLEARHSAG
jgi:hypothetical protein